MKELGPMKYEHIVSCPNEPIFQKKTFFSDIFTRETASYLV